MNLQVNFKNCKKVMVLSLPLLVGISCGRLKREAKTPKNRDNVEVINPAKPESKDISFKVASYNVENLWDSIPENTPSTYSDYAAATSNWYPNGTASKITRVAEAIDIAGNPEILGMQEFEFGGSLVKDGTSCASLEELWPLLESKGYKFRRCANQDSQTAITNVLVSKFPIISHSELTPDCDANRLLENGEASCDPLSNRRILVAVVAITEQVDEESIKKAPKLRIFNSHFKSKGFDSKKPCREQCIAQMQKSSLSKIVSEISDLQKKQDPVTATVLVGDFNTDLFALKETGNIVYNISELLSGDAQTALYDLWLQQGQKERGSVVFNGKRTTIDHILVNRTMANSSNFSMVENGFSVIGYAQEESKLRNATGAPFRSQVKLQNGVSVHQPLGYSDHLPLVAKFVAHGVDESWKLANGASKNNVSNVEESAKEKEFLSRKFSQPEDVGQGVNPFGDQDIKLMASCSPEKSPALESVSSWQLGLCVKIDKLGPTIVKNRDALKISFSETKVTQWLNSSSDKVVLVASKTEGSPNFSKLLSEKDFTILKTRDSFEGCLIEGVIGKMGFDRGEPVLYVEKELVVSGCIQP